MSSPGLGPSDRLVEEPPTDPSTSWLWVLMLSGPVIWISHFGLVYLLAEYACAAADSPEIDFFGPDVLTVVVLATTVVAAFGAGGAGWLAWRRARRHAADPEMAAWAGVLLDIGSVVAILAVGLPIVFLEPCS